MPKTDDFPDFAARLAQVMGQLNFSRAALARELAVDKTVVRRWLAGINAPTEHNLTRLTDIVRRQRPDFTLAHWADTGTAFAGAIGAATSPVTAPSPVPAAAPPSPPPVHGQRLRLSGLRHPFPPAWSAPYVGVWAGYYQSVSNQGLIRLCAMACAIDDEGLRAAFTEGSFYGEGPAVAGGAYLTVLADSVPLYDRFGYLLFNGVRAVKAMVMDGLVTVPAGDTGGSPTASPIVLFRIALDPPADLAAWLPRLRPGVAEANRRFVAQQQADRGETAAWRDLVPPEVVRTITPRIGVPGPDGQIEHVMRMPTSRSLSMSDIIFEALPADSALRAAPGILRRLLGPSDA